MKHTIIFDTLECAEELIKAGFSKKQAEGQARLLKKQTDEFNGLIDSNLATKHDIELTRKDIELVRKDLEKINERTTITLWIVSVLGFANILPQLITLIKQVL